MSQKRDSCKYPTLISLIGVTVLLFTRKLLHIKSIEDELGYKLKQVSSRKGWF